jgi:hypothetical protein
MCTRIFSCIVLLVLSLGIVILHTEAQTRYDDTVGCLTGRIVERFSGLPIAGAIIKIRGEVETTADENGEYRLELTPGTYPVRVSAPGYTELVLSEIGVTASRTTIKDVQLDFAMNEQVEVRSGAFAENPELPVSGTTLNRAEIRSIPGTGGDPLRALNSLPAVTAASTEFADLIVRGGSSDENLTFIDNIPVDDFTYLTDRYDNGRGGRLGILVPDVIDRLEFSSGGFGPRYGDFMSSVLDIRLRTAARDRIQGVLFSDSGSAGLTVEVPVGRRGGWLFSARRSYLDVALDIADIGNFGRPRNFDFVNKFDLNITPRNRLTFTALNLFERFTLNREEAAQIDRRLDRLETTRASRRMILGATLSTTFGTRTLSQITTWAIGEHNDGTFLRVDNRMPQRTRDLRDSQYGIKAELTSAISPRILIATGGGVFAEQANYYTFERSGFGFSPLEEEFFAPTHENRFQLDTTVTSYAYGQVTWRPTTRLAVTPGGRIDRYGRTAQMLLSPRVSARYNLTSRVTLDGAVGVYRQPPSLFVLSLAPENRGLRAQRAVHVIGGAEWLAREDVRVRVEAYQKSYDDLIVRPTRLSPRFFNTGEGTARGLEISVQKALVGRFSGQAAYSFVRSRRRFDDASVSFPADIERPHQLTLIGITRVAKFNLAAKLRVASGLPYTPTLPVEFAPNTNIFLQRIERPEDRNSARLPTFANLDLRIERRFDFRRFSFAPYVDFFNVTGHSNNTELEYDFFSPSPIRLREGSVLPIFGARIEF